MDNTRDNIVLIGMPGAGKSTLGVILAKSMGFNFIDADLCIQSEQRNTLQNIINTQGTQSFMEIESQALQNINPDEPSVIATGGSAIYSSDGMKHLQQIGIVIYLRISLEETYRRVSNFEQRGLVTKGKVLNLKQLYEERIPEYEKYAEITVDIDGLTISQALQGIWDALEKFAQ